MDDAQNDVPRLPPEQRRARAIELKLGGFTYERIARELGYYDRSHARRDILDALAEIMGEQRDNALHLVDLMWERYERILAANWLPALQRDPDATMAVLKVTAAQIGLRGLAAPVRVDFDRVRAAFERLMAPDADAGSANTDGEDDPED